MVTLSVDVINMFVPLFSPSVYFLDLILWPLWYSVASKIRAILGLHPRDTAAMLDGSRPFATNDHVVQNPPLEGKLIIIPPLGH